MGKIELLMDKEELAMTIKEIKEFFKSQAIEDIPSTIERFSQDPRQGVSQTCKQYERKYKKYQQELERTQLMSAFDRVFQEAGQSMLAGIDEAGRGPLAGPVVAASVILPEGVIFEGLNDSKALTALVRDRLYDEIMEKAICVGVGIVDAHIIDEVNILQATFRAMKEAVLNMKQGARVLLVDGNQTIPGIDTRIAQHAIIQGDAKSASIAAASIIAKVTRDRMMATYHTSYPAYNFAGNKGYGSMDHVEALKQIGPSEIHRKSFLKNILS